MNVYEIIQGLQDADGGLDSLTADALSKAQVIDITCAHKFICINGAINEADVGVLFDDELIGSQTIDLRVRRINNVWKLANPWYMQEAKDAIRSCYGGDYFDLEEWLPPCNLKITVTRSEDGLIKLSSNLKYQTYVYRDRKNSFYYCNHDYPEGQEYVLSEGMVIDLKQLL